MGAAQASRSVLDSRQARERGQEKATPEELELRAKVKQSYEEQTDMRCGARGRLDAIIQPHETRDVLIPLLNYVSRPMPASTRVVERRRPSVADVTVKSPYLSVLIERIATR